MWHGKDKNPVRVLRYVAWEGYISSQSVAVCGMGRIYIQSECCVRSYRTQKCPVIATTRPHSAIQHEHTTSLDTRASIDGFENDGGNSKARHCASHEDSIKAIPHMNRITSPHGNIVVVEKKLPVFVTTLGCSESLQWSNAHSTRMSLASDTTSRNRSSLP